YKEPFQMKLKLFGNRELFDAYFAQQGGGLSWAAALYSPMTKEVFAYKMKDREQMVSSIIHETSHRVFGEYIPSGPPWLNEGLADYFAMSRASGNSVVISPDYNHDKVVRSLLRSKQLPDLNTHLRLNLQQWQANHTVNYPIAWSLVYFLMSSSKGKILIQKMLYQLVYKRKEPFDSVVIIDKNYPGGIKLFERDWHASIEKRKSSQSFTSDVRRRAKFEIIPVDY
ncbi:MAG: DUF1570 domain-containing protein, partial [Verrucomicrobiota bacterium]